MMRVLIAAISGGIVFASAVVWGLVFQAWPVVVGLSTLAAVVTSIIVFTWDLATEKKRHGE